jgi:hypothetical protein
MVLPDACSPSFDVSSELSDGFNSSGAIFLTTHPRNQIIFLNLLWLVVLRLIAIEGLKQN